MTKEQLIVPVAVHYDEIKHKIVVAYKQLPACRNFPALIRLIPAK